MPNEIMWEKYKSPFHREDDEDEFTYKDSDDDDGFMTPFGVIPMSEANDISKMFNMWMAHTNFNFRVKHAKSVAKLEGVESLCIISRYRFRVGVGKLYNENVIKNKIEQLLCCNTVLCEKEVKKQPIHILREQLIKQNECPYWAIYLMPDNKTIKSYKAKSRSEVQKRISELSAQPIYTSWD